MHIDEFYVIHIYVRGIYQSRIYIRYAPGAAPDACFATEGNESDGEPIP